MNFEHPLLLLMIAPLCLIWLGHFMRNRSAEEKRRFPLLIGSLVFLITALANPYWSTIPAQRVLKGVDLLLLVDVSQSMFCPSGSDGIRRIDQARHFLKILLPEYSGSQVAVVYFAGDAQIGSPFSSDLRATYLFLDSITPAMTTVAGTRSQPLQQALGELLGRDRDQSSRKPLILLFSDGEFFDNTGRLQAWLEDFSDLRLFSFICGTGKAAVPKFDLAGPYQKAISEVRPASMQALATSGRGLTFHLSQTNSNSIAKQLNRKVTDIIAAGEMIPLYRPGPFLLISFLLLIGYQAFPLLALGASSSKRAVLAPIALLLVVSLSMKAEDREKRFTDALDDIRNKKYDVALKKLKALESEKSDPEIELALGNLYFKQARYTDAISQYKKILEKNPEHPVARWNWEVAIKRQTQSRQPPPKQERPRMEPQDLPDQTQALLKYFDQLEKEQMQQQNKQNANTSTFAW